MKFRRAKFSPMEKELQRIEREEQNLFRYADKHKSDPVWKIELESRIPEKVMISLQKAFSKAFYLIFEKGAMVIEKTYDKSSIEKSF